MAENKDDEKEDKKEGKDGDQGRLAPIDRDKVADVVGAYIDLQKKREDKKAELKDLKVHEQSLLEDLALILNDSDSSTAQLLKKAFNIMKKEKK